MPDRATIIVFSGELDKALAAFNIAIGAASMGMEVSMFFTFWGLNVIKKNEGPIKSLGIMRKMLNRMNRGGSRRLPLSKFHMLGLGKWMMGKLMRDVRFPPLEELMVVAKGKRRQVHRLHHIHGDHGHIQRRLHPAGRQLRRRCQLPGRGKRRKGEPIHLGENHNESG